MLAHERPLGPPGEQLFTSLNPHYQEYMSMPRAGDAARLFNLYSQMREEPSTTVKYGAGWALAEAALSPEDISNRWRQDVLNESATLWREASEGLLTLNNPPANEPDFMLFPEMSLRYKLSLAHHPALKAVAEVIAGNRELPDQKLLDKTYDNLIGLSSTILRHINEQKLDPERLRGVAYELIFSILLHRDNNSYRIALPPSARQDFGGHRSMRSDSVVRNLEEKGYAFEHLVQIKGKITKYDKRHYSPHILLLSAHQDLTLPKSSTAVDTLRAIVQEYWGAMNPRDVKLIRTRSEELDSITEHLNAKLSGHPTYAHKLGGFAANQSELSAAA